MFTIRMISNLIHKVVSPSVTVKLQFNIRLAGHRRQIGRCVNAPVQESHRARPGESYSRGPDPLGSGPFFHSADATWQSLPFPRTFNQIVWKHDVADISDASVFDVGIRPATPRQNPLTRLPPVTVLRPYHQDEQPNRRRYRTLVVYPGSR